MAGVLLHTVHMVDVARSCFCSSCCECAAQRALRVHPSHSYLKQCCNSCLLVKTAHHAWRLQVDKSCCIPAATKTDLVHCQPANEPCNSWYGHAPDECPLSGDAAAFNAWAGCKELSTCDGCLMYGGEKPQCVWCVASGKCVGSQTADAQSAQCREKLTRGPKVCLKKSAANATKP
jgi:hypothetical protein